jgi:hypothetical protein
MKYKVGDHVRILNNQGQHGFYKNGDKGTIHRIGKDNSVEVKFDNGKTWWVWTEGDNHRGEKLLAEDCFEVLDPLSSSTIERKVKDIVFTARSVAHLQNFEGEIMPAADLIEQMLDILKEHGIVHELTLP